MANRAPRLPLFILAITLIVVFHRVLFGEVFFWGLPSLQFYPWREYAFDLLRTGHLPLWNAYNGGGAPLLANYQSALLYPLNWLGLIMPLAWQMSVIAVLHLFIAGWGMWSFTGRLGVSSLGRGISALAYAMSGYLVARLSTYPTITAAAWIPWILWAALGILTHFRRRDVGILAVFTALQLLAGHAQTTWYSMLLVGMFSIWWVLYQYPVNWRRLLIVIAGLVLGGGIAAAQLLPTAELLAQSQRSGGVDYDFAMNFSYSLPRTLNFLSPNIFGNPADGSYIAKGAFFEDAVYIGLIPLISALVAIIVWVWGKLRHVERPAYFASLPFWMLIVVIGFVFALGSNSPIFPFLYKYIPTFSLFQAPVRWHIWTVFALSVLAGMGAGAWNRGYWLFFGTRLAIAACIGAVLLALIAPSFLPPDISLNDGVQIIIRAVIGIGLLGVLAGALTLLQPEILTGRRYTFWITAVWLVIAVDLAYAAGGLNPTISASFYDPRFSLNSSSSRAYWPEEADEVVRYEKLLPFADYRVTLNNADTFRASRLANLNIIDRVPLLNNFDPLLVGVFDQYVDLLESNPAQRDSLLQTAGVNAIYDINGNLTPLNQSTALAWVVESACWHPDEASLISAMLNPDWQPLRQVHLLGEGDCPNVASVSDSVGEVMAITNRGSDLDLRLNAISGGWLVIASTNYPGWYATDDSAASYTIHRANLAFTAIDLSPLSGQSENEVTMHYTYQPGWLWVGLFISLVSILVTLVLFRSKSPSSNA